MSKLYPGERTGNWRSTGKTLLMSNSCLLVSSKSSSVKFNQLNKQINRRETISPKPVLTN